MFNRHVQSCVKVVGVSPLCRRFGRSRSGDKTYSSQMTKSDRASYVCAYWISDNNSHIDVRGTCRTVYLLNIMSWSITLTK